MRIGPKTTEIRKKDSIEIYLNVLYFKEREELWRQMERN